MAAGIWRCKPCRRNIAGAAYSLTKVAHLMLTVSVCSAGKALTPLAVTAFIPTRAVTVLLTLWDALSSNTGLPWQAVTLSRLVGTIYIFWPVTNWAHRIII